MEQFTICRDNERDLRFTGEMIASVDSKGKSNGRWTVLKLYKTESGKYVAEQIGRTNWDGEHDRFSATVCETENDVIEALGTGWLAKELYEQAGIECIENI